MGCLKSQSSSFLAIEIKCLSTGADVVSAIPNRRKASATFGPQYLQFTIFLLVVHTSPLIAEDKQEKE